MKAALSGLFVIAMPSGIGAQEAVTIPLRFEKKVESASHGFLPLFEYGHERRILHEGEERAIVPPVLEEGLEVAYGFVYFTGQPGGELDRDALFLVEGYTGSEPRFFVDLNNNLDLTDDEPAVEREGDSNDYLLTLRAEADPRRTFTVRLSFFRDDPMLQEHPELLAQYSSILSGYTKRMGGVPTPPEHWFGDQRLNVRSASVRVGEWAFQIGVYDEDCDGSYSSLGADLVLVGEFEGEYLSRSKSGGATPIAAETLVQVDDQTFEVLEIDPAGAFVRIVPSDKPYDRLRNGSLLPELEVTLFDGDRTPLSSFLEPGKYLLIDFWGHWCKGCILALPELKRAADELGDVLTILSLHQGDHAQARKIIEDEELSWLQAEVTDTLVEAFLVDSWPTYVLVDEEGRIQSLDIPLHEALRVVRAAERD